MPKRRLTDQLKADFDHRHHVDKVLFCVGKHVKDNDLI
jgi:hypothetical protein